MMKLKACVDLEKVIDVYSLGAMVLIVSSQLFQCQLSAIIYSTCVLMNISIATVAV
jgi:hypothetical protein